MKMTLALGLIIAFNQMASASTFEERARQSSEATWHRQLGLVQARMHWENRKQISLLTRFIMRHGGATTNVACTVDNMSCYNEGKGYTVCIPVNSQEMSLGSIDPNQSIRISNCSFDLRDELACQTSGTGSVACYDPSKRYRSFKIGK